MILYKETSWWYWAVTAFLLVAGLAGGNGVFLVLATALSAVQVVHFRLREQRFAAFPVQVRACYLGLLLLALWGPMGWLTWPVALGTLAQVLFGYCVLARSLSLAPWNRREALSWGLAWRTFAARPVRGSVLQGLPAAR